MPLDIRPSLEQIRSHYQQTKDVGYNVMVYGQGGTGKTQAISTCPTPVLIQSFDRHGWSTIRHLIDGKKFIVDNRFEGIFGSRNAPGGTMTVYEFWESEIRKMSDSGFFDKIGTLVIDSATTWSLSIMDAILRRDGKKTGRGWMIGRKDTPDMKAWQIQMECLRQALDSFLSLPCTTYLICHEIQDKDEESGRTMTLPFLTGKLKETIPPMFDEVYRVDVRPGATQSSYRVLTQNDGNVIAKSRLAGTPPKLDKFEEFNIKKMMAKVGLSNVDKPDLE